MNPWIQALLLLALLPGIPAQDEAGSQGPIHVRVTFGEDPAHEAVVSWSTVEKGESHRLHFDVKARSGTDESYAKHVDAQLNGACQRGETVEFHYHHARITGLTPATTYYFAAASDDQRSREFHFRTGPADDREFQLIVGGDSRSGHKSRQAVNRFIAKTFAGNPDIVAMVHGGDYVMFGDNPRLWRQWLTHQELTTTNGGRILPVIPTRGNHEAGGEEYDKVFAAPGGGKGYYTSRIGSGLLLLVLNTETVVAGDQRKFLKSALVENAKRRWQVASYHRPAFPAVKKPCHALQHWVPLFDEYRLDLAFESDGHVIKRTVPILDGKQDADGVVYMGEGGLGVSQRRPDSDRWYLQAPGMTSRGHHIDLLTVSKERLRCDVLLVKDGKVEDSWERKPRQR